jgi:hypothetical protein
MEYLQYVIHQPFAWGLLLGLLVAAFTWKSGFSARRNVCREMKRVEGEMKDLQGHLHTQLKINANGNELLQTELDSLRKQNEILRVNHAALQQKPDRATQRQFQVQEIAVRTMREQALGFAPAWEKAVRQAEAEMAASESGFGNLIRKVIPGLSSSIPASALTIAEETTERR